MRERKATRPTPTALAAAVGLLLAAPAVAAPAQAASPAPEPRQVRLGYMPIAEEAPKFVAKDKGLFKARGLGVELVRFESGPDMGTALLGGSISIGMIGTPGLINAAVANRPLVYILDNGSNVLGAGGYEYYTGLVVLDESPIKDFGDLKGKTIAMNVLKANSETQTVMQAERWNREHPDRRIDLTKDVRIIPIPFGSMPGALERGVADAASMIEPFTTQLMMKRKARVIAPVAYAMPTWPVSYGVVRRDFAAKNPGTVTAYKTAFADAVRWIQANPEEAKRIMGEYAGVPPEVAARMVLPTWGLELGPIRERTRSIMEAMLRTGMIPKAVDLSQFIIEDVSTLRP